MVAAGSLCGRHRFLIIKLNKNSTGCSRTRKRIAKNDERRVRIQTNGAASKSRSTATPIAEHIESTRHRHDPAHKLVEYVTSRVAARIQRQSHGGDIVMAADFAGAPEVASVLDAYSPSRETVELTGFSKPIAFRRIGAREFTYYREIMNRYQASH